MSQEAIDRREKLNSLRGQYLKGELEFNEAAELVQPLLDSLNEASEAIAKKYGKKFRKWTTNDILKGKGFSI